MYVYIATGCRENVLFFFEDQSTEMKPTKRTEAKMAFKKKKEIFF